MQKNVVFTKAHKEQSLAMSFIFLQLGRGPTFKYRQTDTFTSINTL